MNKLFKIVKKLIELPTLKIRKTILKARLAGNADATKTILFFLPEVGVPLYLDMLLAIAEETRRNGYVPIFFGCNGFLNNCLLMDRTDKQSRTIKNTLLCANCSLVGANKILNQQFGYLDCAGTKKNKIAFQGETIEERLQYSYKGVPIGRLAYYDLSIKYKRDRGRLKLSDKEIEFYDSIICDSVSIVDFLDEDAISTSACALISIDEYCLANTVREWARVRNKLAFRAGFSYHFNADPQFVTLSEDKTRALEKLKRAKKWADWQDLPLPPALVKEIASDLIFRMSGSGGHIFSLNYTGNISKFIADYNVRQNTRTLVVFTSANDEIDALEELSQALGDSFNVRDAFKNQFDWIKYIIDFASVSNVQVIIKMHPRLSSSHRDVGVAEDIHLYNELAASSPDNVIFVWPADKVSAYDILQLADVCLTSWGTMGLEAAKLGIPVVSGITRFTTVTPQITLFLKAETVEQFYEMITRPSKAVCVNDIIEAYRWHHLLHMSGSIIVNGERDIKLYSESFELGFSDVLRGSNIADEKYKFLCGETLISKETSIELELIAMKDSLANLVKFFEGEGMLKTQHTKLVPRLRALYKSAPNYAATH